MAVNPRRRQQKLEKKRAEKKAQKKLIARRNSISLAAKFRDAPMGRPLHCEFSETLWTDGIGHVWIGRDVPGGSIAFVAFLVDVHCLGVKDAFGGIEPRHQYYERHSQFAERFETEAVSLECARKLVEGAVAYAARADLAPHPDYRALSLIFADADASQCPREFEYGHEGKPYFVQGPYDTPARCREVMDKLVHHYGSDGFHFLVGGPDIREVTGLIGDGSDTEEGEEEFEE